MKSLFLTRRFLPLFVAQFFGAFNDNFLKNAILIMVVYRGMMSQQASEGLANLAAALFLLPYFLFSTIAGELADKYDFIYAAVGVHPEEIADVDDAGIEKLRQLAKNKKVVAIGEIGLDYHYRDDNKEEQIKAFRRQLDLAKEMFIKVSSDLANFNEPKRLIYIPQVKVSVLPAEKVSGDTYNAFCDDDGNFYFCLFDGMGQGKTARACTRSGRRVHGASQERGCRPSAGKRRKGGCHRTVREEAPLSGRRQLAYQLLPRHVAHGRAGGQARRDLDAGLPHRRRRGRAAHGGSRGGGKGGGQGDHRRRSAGQLRVRGL